MRPWLGSLSMLLVLVGCARFVAYPGAQLPAALRMELPEGKALRLEGSVRGPIHGLGAQLRFRALLSTQAGARIDLFYELDGRDQHDVLLWTSDAILRFDRARGGVQELGDGLLEVAGARLHLAHVALLALGRWSAPAPPASWSRRGSRHRVQDAGIEAELWGPDDRGRVRKIELRWREGTAGRRLTATVQDWQPLLAGELPRQLQLGGHGMRGRAQLEMEAQVVDLEELVDFDPLQGR